MRAVLCASRTLKLLVGKSTQQGFKSQAGISATRAYTQTGVRGVTFHLHHIFLGLGLHKKSLYHFVITI